MRSLSKDLLEKLIIELAANGDGSVEYIKDLVAVVEAENETAEDNLENNSGISGANVVFVGSCQQNRRTNAVGGKSVLLHTACSGPFALIVMYCKLQLSQEMTLGQRAWNFPQSHIVMLHIDNLSCGNMAG